MSNDDRTIAGPTPPQEATTTSSTLAEDLLLLLFQPTSGTIAGEGTLYYVLAGAVLTDLALSGAVVADEGRLGRVTVSAIPQQAPSDPLLREEYDYIAEKPRNVQTVLAAIGPTLRAPVLQRVIERGHLRSESAKLLGLIPTEKVTEGDTGRRAELLARVRAVLVDGAEPDARTAALAALLSGSGTLPQFHREIGWTSAVITKAKQLEQGDWGAAAAAEAVTRTMTAVIVNNVVVSIAVLPTIS